MSEEKMFEELYIQKKRKMKTMIAIGVGGIIAIICVGIALLSHNDQSSSPSTNGVVMSDGGDENGGGGGQIKMRGGISDYFNEDGSVNKIRVNALLTQVPDEYKGMMRNKMGTDIDTAEQSGEVTADQAKALREALGL